MRFIVAKSIEIQTNILLTTIEKLISEEDVHNEKIRPKNAEGFNSKQLMLLEDVNKNLRKELLTTEKTRKMLLTTIFSTLQKPKYRLIFNYILKVILDLNLTPDDWSVVLTTKSDMLILFQQMATQSNPANLAKVFSIMANLDERTRVQIISGMNDYQDAKNCIKYTSLLVKHITAALAFFDPITRGIIFSSRDDEGNNLLAYAVQSDQRILAQLIVNHAEDIQMEDTEFLISPTYLIKENERIYLYILQNLQILAAFQKSNDLETLSSMLKAKNLSCQTGLETAIIETENQRIRQLLLLIKKLGPDDQQEIIDQLSVDAKEKLMSNPDYQELLLPLGAGQAIHSCLDDVNPKALPMFFRPKSVPVDEKTPLASNLFPYKEWP